MQIDKYKYSTQIDKYKYSMQIRKYKYSMQMHKTNTNRKQNKNWHFQQKLQPRQAASPAILQLQQYENKNTQYK